MTRLSALVRFHRSLAVTETCWPWTGGTNRDGYGTFWSGEYRQTENGRRSPIMVLAHRWSYEQFVGPIPDRLNVLHSCDNPGCVNPDHLSVGTQAENVRQCADRGRRNQVRNRRLSAEQKDEIRARYMGAYGQQTELAREYGVSQTAIYAVVGGRARTRCAA